MLKFSCEKALLQQAVSAASRAVASKSSIPALEGILMEGDMNLTLSGYNMQTGIRTAIEAQIHEAGRIVRFDGFCRAAPGIPGKELKCIGVYFKGLPAHMFKSFRG